MKWNFDKRGHHCIPCYLFLLSKSGFFQSNLIFILSNSNVLYKWIQWKNAKYQQIAMLIVKKQMIILDDFKDDYNDFTIISTSIKSMPIASISFNCQIYCKLIFFGSRTRIKSDLFFSMYLKCRSTSWYQRRNQQNFVGREAWLHVALLYLVKAKTSVPDLWGICHWIVCLYMICWQI